MVEKGTDVSDIIEEEELDEEPGEVIESAPPLKVGQEREITSTTGLKKKLLKRGHGWETPDLGDEVTVHSVSTFFNGNIFDSTRDEGKTFTFQLGYAHDKNLYGLDLGIITMKKGELALFTVHPGEPHGPDYGVQYEIELISWIKVVDICKDGGIIKKILEKGKRNEQPSDLDEVMVKYQVMLADGSIVAKTSKDGVEFYLKDGHFCPALPKAVRTMKRGEHVKLVVKPHYAFGVNMVDPNNGFPAIPPNSVLNIDLKLISFKPVVDICGDLKVVKNILKEGEGVHTANEGAAVTIRYTAKLEDGTIFEVKGLNGDPPLEFVTDEDQVILGLDRAAATMKKGEMSVVTVQPEYGFGSVEVQKDLSLVPPCSTLIYEVEMVDFSKEKAPWEMNNQERIETAEKKKEEGNILFKSENYLKAAKRYDKAVDYITEDGPFGDDEQKLVKSLRVSCRLNHAACCLKLNSFQEAIKLCSKVLDVEFHNVKALYRRAQAYTKTADFDLAELDIKKALDIDPNNREVKVLHKTLKQLESESSKRDAKLYSNMFAPMREDYAILTKKRKIEKEENNERNGVVASTDIEKGNLGGASNELSENASSSPP